MKTLEGQLKADNLKFGIVVGRFNEFISSKLLSGSIDCLVRHGADNDNITVAWVPGAFEIPLVAKKMAATGKFDAIICLGAVIRGATPHFDYVCAEVSKGIANVSLQYETPVAFGVLTTENIEQAVERAGTKAGNKLTKSNTVSYRGKSNDELKIYGDIFTLVEHPTAVGLFILKGENTPDVDMVTTKVAQPEEETEVEEDASDLLEGEDTEEVTTKDFDFTL